MGATRDKEREAHWRRNKELRKKLGVPGAVVSIAEIDKSIADFCRQHWQPGWEEARRARGPELVRTLLHLAREWNDKRFVEAVKALTELQLVDEGYGFIPGKRGPGLADLERQISARKQQLDDEQIERVRSLHEQGMSILKASKKVAEDAGRPNYSFVAAHTQLRNRVRARKKGHPARANVGKRVRT